VCRSRPAHPALYQVNTRVWLHERGTALGRPATLDDVTDAALDGIAAAGFDWAWLLGVWQTGEASRRVSLTESVWQREYRELLPDVTPEDVCGSPFAVREYVVHHDFGGPTALVRLRRRLAARGVGLVLDFVPNHTALDHAWVHAHPEFYVAGTEVDLAREPGSYVRIDTPDGPRIMAHGRDPHFPGWPDTLQLDHRHAGLRAALLATLQVIAEQCDGVRCDMAMLLLPDVVRRTWGEPAAEGTPVDTSFWPEAIAAVRARHPGFVFIAEAYWDLEGRLQQEGFDYTYDKGLYDRLRARDADAVRDHLGAEADYQRRCLRFLENHDEPRAATVFPRDIHEAAAVLTLLGPGLGLVHDGQTAGRRMRPSVHLRRRAAEPVDQTIESFYARLLAFRRRSEVRHGRWRLLATRPVAAGDETWRQLIAFLWEQGDGRLLVAVNYGPERCRAFVPLVGVPLGPAVRLLDLITQETTTNAPAGAEGDLCLDVPGWGLHVLEVTPSDRG
jgi:glycosidase